VGTEMVVDHVEDDAKTGAVRRVHEGAEVVRASIQASWGKEVDTIVTPAEPAGKIGHRHHLDGRDPGGGELGKLPGRGGPVPFGSEGADVELVEHLALERDAGPVGVAPAECEGIDHFGGPGRTMGMVP